MVRCLTEVSTAFLLKFFGLWLLVVEYFFSVFWLVCK
jgi:hypothetical protein